MKLVDMQVKEYLDVLKSDAPAPGGGSVSALAGAQGVGLFMMVADLTLGKEKYADYQEVCKNAKEKGMPLYEELVEGIDKDTEAFNLVAAAFKMPKATDEEKAARKQAIADGTLVSTEVPFRTMQLGLRRPDAGKDHDWQVQSQRCQRLRRCYSQSDGLHQRCLAQCEDQPSGHQG